MNGPLIEYTQHTHRSKVASSIHSFNYYLLFIKTQVSYNKLVVIVVVTVIEAVVYLKSNHHHHLIP